jgi:hypothetical protein
MVPTPVRDDRDVTAVLTRVPPPVGSVHVDDDGTAMVGLKAPVVAKFPESVSVNDPLLTPEPPSDGGITLPIEIVSVPES